MAINSKIKNHFCAIYISFFNKIITFTNKEYQKWKI